MPPAPISGVSPSDPRRVLVVDDDFDSADLTAFLLEGHGHETKIAHTGKDALALAATFLPQIAFLDVDLPDMDGFDLARALRSNHSLRRCRLVAVSGHEARKEGRELFDAQLQKPVELDELLRLVGESARLSIRVAEF